MKMRKRIMAFSLCTLMLLGGIVSTYAYTYVNGSSYQSVSYINIPAWGNFDFNTYYGSKKVTTSTLATFKKTWGQAALGNYGVLVTSSKTAMSEMVGIPLNKANWASSHGVSKGSVYFSAVSSHNLEPANTCDIDIKFSADTLELPN